MILYGFDPGETVGYAAGSIQDRNFSIEDVKHLTQAELDSWCLQKLQGDPSTDVTLVVEDYVIDPARSGYSHQGDKGIALRQIGQLRLVALALQWKFVPQPNWRKPAGYRYLNLPYKKGKKGRHLYDALAHLGFYGIEHRLWVPTVLEAKPEKPFRPGGTPRISRVQSDSVWRKPHTEPDNGTPDISSSPS